MEGHWLDRDALITPVRGRILFGWAKGDWFTSVTKLTFPDSDRPENTQTYKGRLDPERQRYTFLLQDSDLGKVEGEGWVGPNAIVQHYWVMDDKLSRTGFQTFYRRDDNRYALSAALMAGSSFVSMMEAVLTRHPDPE